MKVDWCSAPPGRNPMRAYRAIAKAARAAGRKMIVAVSIPGFRYPWRWAADHGNLWRIADDANGSWSGVMSALDADAPLWPYAAPGRWNDPDILQVGAPALTSVEERAHFSLWSMLAAPLIAGYDLSALPAASVATLTNREVIAVDQDPAGCQGRRVGVRNGVETWVRPLADGSWAVLFLNRRAAVAKVSVRADRIPGLPLTARYWVRDLWAHASRPVRGGQGLSVQLAGHEAAMWRVRPVGGFTMHEWR